MIRYFVSIGSNIQPQQNIQHVFPKLLQLSPILPTSRIVQTLPVGIPGGEPFLNLSVCLTSHLSEAELKQTFNQIEASLGRDRSDSNRKYKSRPMDLDILFCLAPGETAVSEAALPTEPYIRPTLIELLNSLGIEHPAAPPVLPDGVAIPINGRFIGTQPTTLHKRQHPTYQPSIREAYTS